MIMGVMTERSSLNSSDSTRHTLMEDYSQASPVNKQSLWGKGWHYLRHVFSIVTSVICIPSTGLGRESCTSFTV